MVYERHIDDPEWLALHTQLRSVQQRSGSYQRDGTIREKYNVVTRSSETNVKAGYAANVIGFGWTNAAFVELLHSLPAEKVAHMEHEIPSATASR